MAVRSSSSLHVRQTSDLSLRHPPSKRPRLQQQHLNSPSSPASNRHLRRRGSSPDLLDTTVEPAISPKPINVRAATNSPLSTTAAVPPLRASRRPRLITTTTTTSSYNNPPPSPPPSSNKPRTPHTKHRNDAVSATPALLRESPDPLDTISPAPAFSSSRSRPSATRYPRQHQQQNKVEGTPTGNNVSRSNVRSTRRNSNPSETQQPPVPAAQATSVRERRSLRSHDTGTKLRSELASYFPNYEQLISLEPQKRGMIRYPRSVAL